MITAVTHLTLLVNNQEKALDFYVNKLGFKLHTDATLGEMRWLTVHAQGQPEFEIALMHATTEQEKQLIGKQAGEHPLFALATSDCLKDYETLRTMGVEFLDAPKQEPWGIAAPLKDVDGNVIYLCQTINQ